MAKRWQLDLASFEPSGRPFCVLTSSCTRPLSKPFIFRAAYTADLRLQPGTQIQLDGGIVRASGDVRICLFGIYEWGAAMTDTRAMESPHWRGINHLALVTPDMDA